MNGSSVSVRRVTQDERLTSPDLKEELPKMKDKLPVPFWNEKNQLSDVFRLKDKNWTHLER